MAKSTREIKEFGCQNRGHPYKAYPPVSSFKDAYVIPCKETEDLEGGHNFKLGYDCEDCVNRNFLY